LALQLEKLKGCDKVFKEKGSGVDAGRQSLRLALSICGKGTPLSSPNSTAWRVQRQTFNRIVSQLTEKGVAFEVVDDPSIDISTRTGKLIMGILALIAEFENDIRRERKQAGINKAKAEGARFGPKPLLRLDAVRKIKELRADGATGARDPLHHELPISTVQFPEMKTLRVRRGHFEVAPGLGT
jgi:DNA invertase Pin-like site-specific DNA recombinase